MPMTIFRKLQARLPRQHAQESTERHVDVFRQWTMLLLIIVLAAGLSPTRAPGQEKKSKVPGLSKLTSGPSQQAFDGIVQSLDMKRKILNVNTVQGQATEIFPIGKNMDIVTANGDRRTLNALKPGTNVFILYEQRGDRRTVKQIVILAAGPKADKKPAPPS